MSDGQRKRTCSHALDARSVRVTGAVLATLRQSQLRSLVQYMEPAAEEFGTAAEVAFLSEAELDNVRTTLRVLRAELDALDVLISAR